MHEVLNESRALDWSPLGLGVFAGFSASSACNSPLCIHKGLTTFSKGQLFDYCNLPLVFMIKVSLTQPVTSKHLLKGFIALAMALYSSLACNYFFALAMKDFSMLRDSEQESSQLR